MVDYKGTERGVLFWILEFWLWGMAGNLLGNPPDWIGGSEVRAGFVVNAEWAALVGIIVLVVAVGLILVITMADIRWLEVAFLGGGGDDDFTTAGTVHRIGLVCGVVLFLVGIVGEPHLVHFR
jgi:hypothetical protein